MGRILESYEAFILADVAAHGQHTGWDCQADMRFAEAFGYHEIVNEIAMILDTEDLFAIRAYYKSKPTLRRHKILRIHVLGRLRKQGKIQAEWVGTKEGGYQFFGVKRERVYTVKKGCD